MTRLEKEGIVLRPLGMQDAEAVQSWAGNPANVRYMTFGPNTMEDTEKFIAESIQNAAAVPTLKYDFVIEKEGKTIGTCGIYCDERQEQGMLGWILHMDYWKQGIMPVVGKLLIEFGFSLGLHRIWANCFAENYGSYRVMEKCGMRREAHFVKGMWNRHSARWEDEYRYAILREEFLQ